MLGRLKPQWGLTFSETDGKGLTLCDGINLPLVGMDESCRQTYGKRKRPTFHEMGADQKPGLQILNLVLFSHLKKISAKISESLKIIQMVPIPQSTYQLEICCSVP